MSILIFLHFILKFKDRNLSNIIWQDSLESQAISYKKCSAKCIIAFQKKYPGFISMFKKS